MGQCQSAKTCKLMEMKSCNPDGQKRVIVLAPVFSTNMNANRPLTVASVLSQFAEVEVVTTDFDHWTNGRTSGAV